MRPTVIAALAVFVFGQTRQMEDIGPACGNGPLQGNDPVKLDHLPGEEHGHQDQHKEGDRCSQI